MLIKVHNFIQFINEKCYTTTCAHISSIEGLNLTKLQFHIFSIIFNDLIWQNFCGLGSHAYKDRKLNVGCWRLLESANPFLFFFFSFFFFFFFFLFFPFSFFYLLTESDHSSRWLKGFVCYLKEVECKVLIQH